MSESLNQKLNFYLPRYTTDQYNFIYAIKNILKNDSVINSTIKRKD